MLQTVGPEQNFVRGATLILGERCTVDPVDWQLLKGHAAELARQSIDNL